MGSEIEKMSPDEVRQLAWDDGYDLSCAEAVAVVEAASEGRLLWTRKRITVTGRGGFDARPVEERRK